MRVSRLSLFGNAIIFALLAFGAWLWWRNVSRGADPPSAAEALATEAAERVGVNRSARAPRRDGGPAGPLIISSSGLAIPVAGIRMADLTDTYKASRGGGSRVHNAIDIMAPRGTPVVAATEGTVEKLFFSRGGGGITAYVRSPDGQWLHYYAHLDSYAPGLQEGQRISRGDPIGTVGISGNASPSGPHLHYAIYRMSPGERWWQGTPINPYPQLAGKGERG
ncbi:M23 family metallopeptidase [Sphingomonas kaistensis]|uniref:M23 family metallopeptidase n=1 Tax=Sphingomonas kaistensis TaxID=298708 RepID=A0ABZ2G2Y6_9SPHN